MNVHKLKEVHIMDFLKVENLYKVYGKNENQVVAQIGRAHV